MHSNLAQCLLPGLSLMILPSECLTLSDVHVYHNNYMIMLVCMLSPCIVYLLLYLQPAFLWLMGKVANVLIVPI